MAYSPDVFMAQYILVDEFVRHLVYYRQIHSKMAERQVQSAFWAACANSNLFQAAIKWSGVFGSHGCNETHWKNLAPGQGEVLQTEFREGLLKFLGVELGAWEAYWKQMLEFRNNFAAHRSLKPNMPVPSFDAALKVAFYYDEWVRRVIHPDTLEARRLSVIHSVVELEATIEIERAFQSYG